MLAATALACYVFGKFVQFTPAQHDEIAIDAHWPGEFGKMSLAIVQHESPALRRVLKSADRLGGFAGTQLPKCQQWPTQHKPACHEQRRMAEQRHRARKQGQGDSPAHQPARSLQP